VFYLATPPTKADSCRQTSISRAWDYGTEIRGRGYSRHFFEFSTTATLFQVQTSSKICHTIKQIYIQNIMQKH